MERSHYQLFNIDLKSDNFGIQWDVREKLFGLKYKKKEEINWHNLSFSDRFSIAIYKVFQPSNNLVCIDNVHCSIDDIHKISGEMCFDHLRKLNSIDIRYNAGAYFYRVVENYLNFHKKEIFNKAVGVGGPQTEVQSETCNEVDVYYKALLNHWLDNIEKIVPGGRGKYYRTLIDNIDQSTAKYEKFLETYDKGFQKDSEKEREKKLAKLRLDYRRARGYLLQVALPDLRKLQLSVKKVYNDLAKWNELNDLIISTFRKKQQPTTGQIEERIRVVRGICLDDDPIRNDAQRSLMITLFARYTAIREGMDNKDEMKQYFKCYRWLFNKYIDNVHQSKFMLDFIFDELEHFKDVFTEKDIFKRYFEVRTIEGKNADNISKKVYFLKLTRPERKDIRDYLKEKLTLEKFKLLEQNDFRVLNISNLSDVVKGVLNLYDHSSQKIHSILKLNTHKIKVLSRYFKYGNINNKELFYQSILELGDASRDIKEFLGDKAVEQRFERFEEIHNFLKENDSKTIADLFLSSYNANQEKEEINGVVGKIKRLVFG